MADDRITQKLRAGIEAARRGDKLSAGQLLQQVLIADKDNEIALMWMASVVHTVEERRVYLRRVLEVNPNNKRASEALSRLGGLPSQPKEPSTDGTWRQLKSFLSSRLPDGFTRVAAESPKKSTPTVQPKSITKPVDEQFKPLTIFISYKSEDRPHIETLAEALNDQGHNIWFDKKLRGGQDWWDEICRNIRERSLIIAALSPSYLTSKACQLEYEYAFRLNKNILPIEIIALGDGIRKLPVQLQRIQLVQWLYGDESDYSLLAKIITQLEPKGSLPHPLPPQPDAPISELSKINDRVNRGDLGDLMSQLGTLGILKMYLNGIDANDRLFAREILGKLQIHADLRGAAVREVDMLIEAFSSKDDG